MWGSQSSRNPVLKQESRSQKCTAIGLPASVGLLQYNPLNAGIGWQHEDRYTVRCSVCWFGLYIGFILIYRIPTGRSVWYLSLLQSLCPSRLYTARKDREPNTERNQATLGTKMAEKDPSAALSLRWHGDVGGRTSEAGKGQMTERWVTRVLRYSSQYDNGHIRKRPECDNQG